MARQDYQIATEVIKLTNSINDLIDVTSYTCRRVDARDGSVLQVIDALGGPKRDPSFEEVQALALRSLNSARNQFIALRDFFLTANYTPAARTVLTNMGITPSELQTEVQSWNAVINQATTAVTNATDDAGLLNIADQIDAVVPKLPLVRRTWAN